MRNFVLFILLAVGIFLSFALQELIPPIHGFLGARVLIFPALLCLGALALPFPAALALGAFTGFAADLAYLHIVDGSVEIGLGWSIVFFVIFTIFAHGFEPSYRRGHWWLLIPLSGLCIAVYLTLQFVMISFRREGFFFSEVVVWRIIGSGLITALLSSLVAIFGWQFNHFFPSRRQLETASWNEP